jgi:hypothetical protein
VSVSGRDVPVLQFGTAEAASEAADAASPDGYSIGATSGHLTTVSQVDWVGTPHFFRTGRLIVLYVGGNKELLGLLQRILGTPFAGGKRS